MLENVETMREFASLFRADYDRMKPEGVNLDTFLKNYVNYGEYDHKAYHPVGDFFSWLLDITIIKPIIECITGTDLITGERLTDEEKGMKMAGAVVDLFTLGQALVLTKGAGILTALVIGAVVAVVVFTGGAALAVALAVGAVVAGAGSAAAAYTYMRDRENSTVSTVGTYINNAGRVSLITAAVIAVFWAAPYAAEGIAMEMTQGLPLTVLFGQTFTYEEILTLASVGTEGIALLNGSFQAEEIGMFFGGTKELGEPTGCETYDDMKELTELYAMQVFMTGLSQWFIEKPSKNSSNTGTNAETETSVEKEQGRRLQNLKQNPLRLKHRQRMLR